MCRVFAVHKLKQQSFSRRIPLSLAHDRIVSGLVSLNAVLSDVV